MRRADSEQRQVGAWLRGRRSSERGKHAARLTTVALAALLAALVVAACGSSGNSNPVGHTTQSGNVKGIYGKLPQEGARRSGGAVSVSQLSGSTPTFIFPIVPVADATVYTVNEFMSNFFLPLYMGPEGAQEQVDYKLSLAEKPQFSDENKTITIHMKRGFTWSNGEAVNASDLVFDIDLILQAVKESAANWSEFSPGSFPEGLESLTATNQYTVVMKLKRAYNPGFFLNDELASFKLFPLPSNSWNIASEHGPHLNFEVPANAKRIYNYLSAAGAKIATFATNPLWQTVDGPFRLTSFSPTNSAYTLVANPHYGGSPKPTLHEIRRETYTGLTPQLNALRTGDLDVDLLDFSQLGSLSSLKSEGFSVYGYPNLGFYSAFFNFEDTSDHFNAIVGQEYFRQALAYLENQPAYVRGIYKNAAVPAYGPVPSLPPTPYTPAIAEKNPFPFDPHAAATLLEHHGWKVVPGGQTTCAKAGAGPEDCGAGIPAGTPIKFSWYNIPPSETTTAALESEAFASVASKSLGIDIELHEKSFNFIATNYDDADPADNQYKNDWGVENFGGFTLDYYPTTNSIFNTNGDYNGGAYSSPTADKLIEESVYGGNPNAVSNEAAYLTKSVPGLFFPNPDKIYAVSNKVGGPPASFLALTQYTPLYQYWYLKK